MANRTKVLVVYSDLKVLSKIYLGLLHRNYKVEASDKKEELPDRIKRFKPSILVLGEAEFQFVKDKLKVPFVLLSEHNPTENEDFLEMILLRPPFAMDQLVQALERLKI